MAYIKKNVKATLRPKAITPYDETPSQKPQNTDG